MRAAAIAVALLTAAVGCRGSHVRHAKPQPDPIGNLERRCAHGKLADCTALAYRYEVGWHLAVDHARARSLYAHACTGNEADACYALGRMRRDGLGGAADPAAADADFVHACNLRDLRGCTAHAIDLEQGLGVPADPDAGHALMRRLCDEDGHPRACANVGVYLLNDGQDYNDGQAKDYLRRACGSDGDALGCHFMAAHELSDLRGEDRYLYEWRRALDDEVGACEEGIGAACAGAARAYREGWSTDDGEDPLDHDDDRATWIAELFHKGCDLGDAESCQGYLLALFDGDGVRQDVRAAARIADTQCTAGYVPSCQSLGYFYEVGVGVPMDLERAESIYRIACSTDTPAGAGSCSNLAELLAESGDMAHAVLLIQKGCDLGDARGCNVGGVNFVDGVWPGDPAEGAKMLRRACSIATLPEDANDYCAAVAGIR